MIPYWIAETLITKAVMVTTATNDNIVVCTSRDMRNENGCEICFWMKRDGMSM